MRQWYNVRTRLYMAVNIECTVLYTTCNIRLRLVAQNIATDLLVIPSSWASLLPGTERAQIEKSQLKNWMFWLWILFLFQRGFLRVRVQSARPARLSHKPVSIRSSRLSQGCNIGILKISCIVIMADSNRLHERYLWPFPWAVLTAMAADFDAEITHTQLKYLSVSIATGIVRCIR